MLQQQLKKSLGGLGAPLGTPPKMVWEWSKVGQVHNLHWASTLLWAWILLKTKKKESIKKYINRDWKRGVLPSSILCLCLNWSFCLHCRVAGLAGPGGQIWSHSSLLYYVIVINMVIISLRWYYTTIRSSHIIWLDKSYPSKHGQTRTCPREPDWVMITPNHN